MQDTEQRGWSPRQFAKRWGCGLTTVYQQIKIGRLRARKVGRRTIITLDDEREWQDSLPKLNTAA